MEYQVRDIEKLEKVFPNAGQFLNSVYTNSIQYFSKEGESNEKLDRYIFSSVKCLEDYMEGLIDFGYVDLTNCYFAKKVLRNFNILSPMVDGFSKIKDMSFEERYEFDHNYRYLGFKDFYRKDFYFNIASQMLEKISNELTSCYQVNRSEYSFIQEFEETFSVDDYVEKGINTFKCTLADRIASNITTFYTGVPFDTERYVSKFFDPSKKYSGGLLIEEARRAVSIFGRSLPEVSILKSTDKEVLNNLCTFAMKDDFLNLIAKKYENSDEDLFKAFFDLGIIGDSILKPHPLLEQSLEDYIKICSSHSNNNSNNKGKVGKN